MQHLEENMKQEMDFSLWILVGKIALGNIIPFFRLLTQLEYLY